jgi:hypothetical protein
MGLHVKKESDYKKLIKPHTDITCIEHPETLADEVAKLQKQMTKLKQELAYVKAQSEKAYQKAFNTEIRLLTLLRSQQTTDE